MSSTLWPWLAVAGAGAVHGLNPAVGWALVAAWRLRSRDGAATARHTPMSRMLWPLAAGHAVSIALVAGAVALGLPMQRADVQAGAATLLVAMLFLMAAMAWRHGRARARGGAPRRAASTLTRVALALWSCAMSTAHGAGLMLVPALVPLCTSGPAREITASGSWPLALAAVALHAAAMLAVVGVMAAGAPRAVQALARRVRGESPTMQRCEPRNALRRPVSRPPTSAPPSACSPPA